MHQQLQRNSMKKFLFSFLFFFAAPLLFAQIDMQPPELLDVPKFTLASFSYADDSTQRARVDVFLQLRYSALKFIKNADKFTSSYEVQISILSLEGELVTERLWNDSLHAGTFEQTVSNKMQTTHFQSFLLISGAYKMIVQVRDEETKKSFRKEESVTVPAFTPNEWDISSVMIVDAIINKEGKEIAIPNVEKIQRNSFDSTKIFLEVYNGSGGDSVLFISRIFSQKGTEVFQDTTRTSLFAGKNKIYYSIPKITAPMGTYTLEVTAHSMHTEQAHTALRTTPVAFRWDGVPDNSPDLETAVAQLLYIASSSTLDSMKDETISFDERQKRFMDFWKQRDPSVSTIRNELMEEYYNRIAFANRNFGNYEPGWKSDRGMVYIIFGAPDNVERHPFDIDKKPYEVWYYYEQNRDFTFVDSSGFGDYRLITPLWDMWGRKR
jgi:GWxTD domain-containing protein